MNAKPQSSFLLSLEEPLQNGIQSGITWMTSWIPASVYSSVTHYTQSAIDSLATFARSLPLHNTLPLAWEAPLQNSSDYWAAHCTTRVEDIMASSPMRPTDLQEDLLDLQHCIGPGTLSPWVLDRSLRDLEQYYVTEEREQVPAEHPFLSRGSIAGESSLQGLVGAHRAAIRDRLLQQPQETAQLLQAELHHSYRRWRAGESRWVDVLESVTDYARVLPPILLQSAFEWLQQQLKTLYREGSSTQKEYQRNKKYLHRAAAQLQGVSLYRDYGVVFECSVKMHDNRLSYGGRFLSGLTTLLTVQVFASPAALLGWVSWLPQVLAQGQMSCNNSANTTLILHASPPQLPHTYYAAASTAQAWTVAYLDAGGLYGQQYNASDGTVIAPPFLIANNTWSPDAQAIGALTNGDWVVVWHSLGQDGSTWGVYGQQYTAEGAPSGSTFRVNVHTLGAQSYPAIAPLTDGGWVVVWCSTGQDGSFWGVYGRRYAADGSFRGGEFQVNTYTMNDQMLPVITALNDGGWVVVWDSVGQDGSGVGLYGQRYTANGSLSGGEFQVNTHTQGNQEYPAIAALSDGGWMVVWESDSQEGAVWGVYGQRYGVDGSRVEQEIRVTLQNSEYGGNYPGVFALSDGGYVIVWYGFDDNVPYGIFEQRYDAQGRTVLTLDWGGQWSPEAFMTLADLSYYFDSDFSYESVTGVVSNNYWLIIFSVNGQGGSPYLSTVMQPYDQRGRLSTYFFTPMESEFQVNTYFLGSQMLPKVAVLRSGDWVAVWQSAGQDGSSYGIYGQRYNANGSPNGSEFPVSTYTLSNQNYAALTAVSDGGWVVVWQSWQGSDPDNPSWNIYGQRYTSDGSPQDGEFQVSSYTQTDQGYPCITGLSDGGWVVVWVRDGGQGGSKYGVYGQRYTVDGLLRGGEFQIGTSYTQSNQSYPPAITGLSDGGWIVVWAVLSQDGSGWDVYGQRYAADGSPRTAAFRVNTHTEGDQYYSAITALSDGGWVVVWGSDNEDVPSSGVYGQRYSADGSPRGDEFSVNTYTKSTQGFPAITALNDGGWGIAWMSFAQDGSGWGVYGQRYAADGLRLGTVFQVNTYTPNDQRYPALSALSDGGWVLVWESDGQDESGYGVYGQRYAAGGAPISCFVPFFVTENGSSTFSVLDVQSQACVVYLNTTWQWVWEETETSDPYPGVITQQIFRSMVYTDGGQRISPDLQGTPCWLDLSRVCLQPWQLVGLSSTRSLLIWGDGYCQHGFTQFTLRVLDANLTTLTEQVLEESLPVQTNYVIYPLQEDTFFLAWNSIGAMNITIVRYQSYQDQSNATTWLEQARWTVPILLNGQTTENGLLTNLRLMMNPWDYSLRVMASVRSNVTDFLDPWVGVLPYHTENKTWTFSQGAKFPSGESENEMEQNLQLIAMGQDTYIGVWQSNADTGCFFDIYVGLYDVDASQQFHLRGSPLVVNENTQGQQYLPQTAWSNTTNRLLVVWIEQPSPAWQPQARMTVGYQLLDATLTPLLTQPEKFGSTVGSVPNSSAQLTCGFLPNTLDVVTNRDGGFLISWLGDHDCEDGLQVYARRLDLDGQWVDFQQSITLGVFTPSSNPYNLTYVENKQFNLPANLLSIYTPAGNVTVKLCFTVPNTAFAVLNAYSQPETLTIIQPALYSLCDGAEWWIQGHFYHINQAWHQIYWSPAADFYGSFAAPAGLYSDSGSLLYQVMDGDGMTPSDGFEPLPLVFWGQHINQAPRALFGQIPWQFSELGEEISLDLRTLIYDVDNSEATLRFEVGPCLFLNATTNATETVSCDHQLSDLRNRDPEEWDFPCPWLSVEESSWLKGMLPEVGDWCVSIAASDEQATSNLAIPFQEMEPTPNSSHLSRFQIIGIAAGTTIASLLGLLLTYAAKRLYQADTAKTRKYKNQLIQMRVHTELTDLGESYLSFIRGSALRGWGTEYLFYNPIQETSGEAEENWQPTIYISAAESDKEGRAWVRDFLMPHLELLSFKVYFEETNSESLVSVEQRIFPKTTYVLVIPSMDYPHWYAAVESESHLIESALNRPRQDKRSVRFGDGSAVIIVFGPQTGYSKNLLPEVLYHHEGEFIPQRRLPLFTDEYVAENMAVLFSLLRCLAPELKEEIQNTESRFYSYEAQVNRRTRRMIEKEIRFQEQAEAPIITTPLISSSPFALFYPQASSSAVEERQSRTAFSA